MTKFTSKVQLIAAVREQLKFDDTLAVKVMSAIYAFQTLDESNRECTMHSNNVGFNHSDAKALTKYSKQAEKGIEFDSDTLATIHRRISKYARQYINHLIKDGILKKVNGVYHW